MTADAASAAPPPASAVVPVREALIDAACDLLREGGREGLTLRRAAARAGVSHAAPAHHFGNLDGLLAAAAGRGFALFAEALERASAAAPDDPRARLRALLDGYLAFAKTHEGMFAVMFRKCDRAPIEDPRTKHAAARAWAALQDACAPFARTPEEARAIELQVWSLAHGYAFLLNAGQVAEQGLGGAATQGDGAGAEAPGVAAIAALLDRVGTSPKDA